jgi:hypothetical protein
MKKQIIITALLLSSLFSFAQKMKVKKDQLFSDKTAVATFTKEKGVFTISSLDASDSIIVTYENCKLSGKFYLEITNPVTNQSNQMPLVKYSPLNESKHVAVAIEEAGFVSENGLELAKVNLFLEGEKFDLATQYGCTLINEGKLKIAAMNLKVTNNGVITRDGNVAIGTMYRNITKDAMNNEIHTYKLYNSSKQVIATAQATIRGGSYSRGTLTAFDNKTMDIPLEKYFSSTYDVARDDNVQMIILILIQNGYNL